MITISSLVAEQIAAVSAIEHRDNPFPWSTETFMTHQGDNYLNLVVCVKDKLVGYLISQIILDEASLFNLTIDQAFHRQGLARQLMQRFILLLAEKRVETLWLEVRASNFAAIALYEQCGFNCVTRRKNYYPTKANGQEDAIIMALTL